MSGRSSRLRFQSILWRSITFLIPCLLALPALLLAQTDARRVRGVVTDPQGALLSQTTVTLTNVDTGRSQTATTNTQGAYDFDNVSRGRYKVEAQRQGFKSTTAEFTVDVSQAREVNLQLQVGAASEMVDVSADVPLVDLETSSTGEVIQGRQV